jgi:hypothetical protein
MRRENFPPIARLPSRSQSRRAGRGLKFEHTWADAADRMSWRAGTGAETGAEIGRVPVPIADLQCPGRKSWPGSPGIVGALRTDSKCSMIANPTTGGAVHPIVNDEMRILPSMEYPANIYSRWFCSFPAPPGLTLRSPEEDSGFVGMYEPASDCHKQKQVHLAPKQTLLHLEAALRSLYCVGRYGT